jgi:hypothetical protein
MSLVRLAATMPVVAFAEDTKEGKKGEVIWPAPGGAIYTEEE